MIIKQNYLESSQLPSNIFHISFTKRGDFLICCVPVLWIVMQENPKKPLWSSRAVWGSLASKGRLLYLTAGCVRSSREYLELTPRTKSLTVSLTHFPRLLLYTHLLQLSNHWSHCPQRGWPVLDRAWDKWAGWKGWSYGMLSEKSEDSECLLTSSWTRLVFLQSHPVPVLCAHYSGPFHGSDQGNEAHMLSPGGPLRKASKLGGSGGSLNTVCHFCKFCFYFLFCFASWLLTLRKPQISRREEQRSDHRCWSSTEEVKPQRAGPGGWATRASRSRPESRAPRAGRFQLSQKKGAKDPHGSPLQGRRGGGLISVQSTPVQTKLNKKLNTLQNIIESRVSTRYQYVEDTILMSRHRKKWEYKIHIQGESNQWRLILTWPDIRMRPDENFIAAIAATAAKSLQSYQTLCDPIDGSPPGSPSLGFSRQEHWSGLPFPSPMHESEKWKWSRSVVSDS